MSDIQHLVAWAAQECEWQQVGPLKVGYLIDAYYHLEKQPELSLDLVMELGHLVEPDKNPSDRWRGVGVRVGFSVKPTPQEVPRLMSRFFSKPLGPPHEAFREFEEIHPFVDGNGRVGALLYNWWNSTLAPGDLVFPPNLWDDSRREDVTL